MRTHLQNLALLTVLGVSVALAQTAPQQHAPKQAPAGEPQSQFQPASQQGKTPADIQSDIQAAFQKDPNLAKASISVQVTEQGVELAGTVPTKGDKDTAERIARAHSGGLEIKNNLKVGGTN